MKRVVVLLLLIYNNCFSQNTVQNQRIWFAYFGQHKFSEKWGVHLEGQLRFDNQFEQNLQNILRVGGIYFLSPKGNITGGYALVHTYNASLDKFYAENRLWEQYQYNHRWRGNKNIITHRLRLEQRWIDQLATNTTNFQNRLRYLNRNLFHLANLKSEKEELYAVLQDEVFLILGKNQINSKFVDQNRFLVGLGFNHKNSLRLELGYMNQFVTSTSGNDVMNHTVSFTLFHNLDWQKQ